MNDISTKYKKEFEEQGKAKPYEISEDDKNAHEFLDARRTQLKESRKKKGVEEIWRAADKAYVPHTLETSGGKKVLQSEDELGWRSTFAEVTKSDNWAEDSAPPNPYVKIQTALGIIVDNNPLAIFKAGKKKFEPTTKLMENLYRRTWEVAKSKAGVLKPMVFNMAKYGLGVGRTYPLSVVRTVHDLVGVTKGKKEWAEVEHTYYDDVFRESLSPWQCFFDDAGTVGNPWSYNDNLWYKDYDWDRFKEQFGHLPNFKFIKPTMRVLDAESRDLKDCSADSDAVGKYAERVWFYENLSRDQFIVETDGGVVLVNEPMPQRPRNKKLSLWASPWSLRNDRDIEGIGVYEAMRNDYKLLLKIRNMTMDQLVLSIYKEWFYEGTDTLEGDGTMRTRPGVGRQVVNPKNIVWNEIPGPGAEAWQALAYQEEKIEEVTGITRGLQGEVVGKTAFEISQARESALKRLKTPLENLTDALEIDAYITVSLIEDIYSIPQIKLRGEDRFIDMTQLDSYMDPETGEMPDHEEVFREIPLGVQKGEDGVYNESKEESFWTAVPSDLNWEGIISIKGQSIVADSELLERETTMQLVQVLLPMFQMPPELVQKPATEILKTYDKDPQDWLPDMWLNPPAPEPAAEDPMAAEDPAAAPAEGGSSPLFVKNGAPAEAVEAEAVPAEVPVV